MRNIWFLWCRIINISIAIVVTATLKPLFFIFLEFFKKLTRPLTEKNQELRNYFLSTLQTVTEPRDKTQLWSFEYFFPWRHQINWSLSAGLFKILNNDWQTTPHQVYLSKGAVHAPFDARACNIISHLMDNSIRIQTCIIVLRDTFFKKMTLTRIPEEGLYIHFTILKKYVTFNDSVYFLTHLHKKLRLYMIFRVLEPNPKF